MTVVGITRPKPSQTPVGAASAATQFAARPRLSRLKSLPQRQVASQRGGGKAPKPAHPTCGSGFSRDRARRKAMAVATEVAPTAAGSPSTWKRQGARSPRTTPVGAASAATELAARPWPSRLKSLPQREVVPQRGSWQGARSPRNHTCGSGFSRDRARRKAMAVATEVAPTAAGSPSTWKWQGARSPRNPPVGAASAATQFAARPWPSRLKSLPQREVVPQHGNGKAPEARAPHLWERLQPRQSSPQDHGRRD